MPLLQCGIVHLYINSLYGIIRISTILVWITLASGIGMIGKKTITQKNATLKEKLTKNEIRINC